MKKLFTFALLIGMIGFANAQYPLESGRLQLNLGTGYTNQGIPAYVGADLGIAENLSLGVDASYRFFNENFGNTMYNHSIITVLGNVNFHFNNMFKLRDYTSSDLYGGFSGGYAMAESPALYGGSVETGAVFGAQFGYRMFFNEKFGLDFQLNAMSTYMGARIGLTILL
ncbi:MAG: hypothetical protein A2W93_04530 [Bacteroidetes bacterium GWF2_43_63]|nr:MAG: hypothetical protein A2W94_12520 [Bacteroidetes bacterium GWE2_42_42]OFY56027.1 MAG: hypothetical protein A2W93_04530 [Bacteroidetes bacterium GWF2_43_63]HBG70728.1 hypothetical protein [Bacteroidales bacterium]HCB62444.1 hypothetical protein [Bacteroidales bacterium]HCY21899.1 hypothetical protein [Bacteroidales bacterium]